MQTWIRGTHLHAFQSSYTLTIPAENMTEYEQGSVWGCYYPADDSYKSPDVVLNIASKIKITYTCIITKENELQM